LTRPVLLDLFCGAGGAAVGYHRAGFDVVGVDVKPQPRYPFPFHQADALTFPLDGYDVIHASPPCQAYTALAAKDGRHPRLIEPTRALLRAAGVPYVIENVPGAPLENPVMLCGTTFGLGVRRHRYFESSCLLFGQRCRRSHTRPIRAYYGKPGWAAWSPRAAIVNGGTRKLLLRGTVEQAAADMGIDWMTWDELREAIPPAYTEYVGAQLLAYVTAAA
jgi:DNA (cytosine-5)-methyltransferase 1